MNKTAGSALAAFFSGALIVTALFANSHNNEFNMPECPTEDSHNCHWDGGSNKQGAEFIDLNGTLYIKR